MTSGTRPRKRFGQHFLEAAWADRVVAAIAPGAQDRFLEIGPGPGALTLRLAPRVRELIAVEIDRDLAARLTPRLPAQARVIEADFLSLDLRPFVDAGPLRVAGNLPYNISSPILFRLLAASRDPGGLIDATIMLQLEVADRLVARVGTGDYGVLTVLIALYADVQRLLVLPPGAFRPMPKVRSAVVRLVFRRPTVRLTDEVGFARMVRTLFMQRRKTVLNALRPYAVPVGADPARALSAAGIDPRARPETLDLETLARLANLF